MDIDISMDIHEKYVDIDMDINVIFHIHGNSGYQRCPRRIVCAADARSVCDS